MKGSSGTIASNETPGVERAAGEFARARRHSRLVRVLRIGLPLVAGLIVVAGLGAIWFARSLPVDIAATSTSIVDGRLVMEDPRMSGVDQNDRPFSMVADRAIQTLGAKGVDLETVRANLTISAGTTAELTAAKGYFDTGTNMLRLYDDIAVETSDGTRVRLKSADVALADGKLTGTGPVEITTPSQRLESGSVTITDRGRVLSFGNRVKLTLMPPSPSTGLDAPSREETP